MWVRRWQWEELWDTAKQASGALFELEEARTRIAELEGENARLRRWLELLGVRPTSTGWARIPPPREFGAEELAESEAAVVPCPTCGQPHGSGGVCAGDVREAA